MEKDTSKYLLLAAAIFAFGGYMLLSRRKIIDVPTLITNEEGNIMKNYFSDKEFTNSSVAKQRGLINEPDDAQWYRLHQLRDKVLNPARERLGYPIFITSGFRSNYLNQLVGGASDSQHTKGEAVDITTKDRDLNRALFSVLVDLGNFDQLIWEKGGEWIHVSYRDGANRNQMLSYNGNGYMNINNNWQTAIA